MKALVVLPLLSLIALPGLGNEELPAPGSDHAKAVPVPELDHAEAVPVPEICLYNGVRLIEEGKPEEGIAELKRAAKGELADAYYNLALCFLQGIAREKNEHLAVRLFYHAAGKGNAEAKYNLGLCYAKGVGVKPNMEKAVRWWQEAAEAGIRDARLNLAVCYRHGLGVPADEERARALEAEGKAE